MDAGTLRAGLFFCGALGLAGTVRAQQILAPTVSYPVTPPAVMMEDSERTGYVGNSQDALQLPDFLDLMRWGPVTLHPHVDYTLSYGSGIESAPGTQNSSLVQEVTPGVLLNIGTHWTIDYSPTYTIYSSTNLMDNWSQGVQLNGGASIDDWTFRLHQGYTYSTSPLVETAAQTTTESYNTEFSLSYSFNTAMSTDLNLTQSILDAPAETGSRSWNILDYLNYAIYRRFVVAVGVGAGYDQVSAGTDMTHEQLQGRISWKATEKLSLVLHAGTEDRQYIHAGVPPAITPVYGASIDWAPRRTTSMSLTLDRSVSPSLFLNQSTDTTALGVGFNQQFFKHLNFSASGAYSQTKYIATSMNISGFSLSLPGRTDNYYSFSLRLAWQFLKRASVSMYYQYGTDSSSLNGFNYNSSQEGLQIGYHL
jgi:hypothetical protein